MGSHSYAGASLDLARRRGGLFARIAAAIQAVRSTLAVWRERARSRRMLAQLRERELADFGVSRSQIAVEIEKPFWRA